jgi:hypothetical protein
LVDERRKRLATMGQRFAIDRGPGRPPEDHNRERLSIYVDRDRWKAVNALCKDVITMLYLSDGLEAKKFDVHEEIFAFAAEHRDEILSRLRIRLSDNSDNSDNSSR